MLFAPPHYQEQFIREFMVNLNFDWYVRHV